MLYGRDSELAELGRLIDGAKNGRSGALSLAGEAGTGKTALLDAVVEQAGGMRVLRGTCIESEAELPFAGLHLLLRAAAGRLDTLPGPQAAALRAAFGLADAAGADRFLTGLATLTLLADLAAGEPLLFICDDAHWLDQASATALQFAARRLEAEGVALILSFRTSGRAHDGAGLPVLRLGPLDPDCSALLLAEYAPDLAPLVRDRIIEQSQGNPLALIELPAALTPAQRGGQPDPRAFHVGTLPVSSRVQDGFAEQISGLPENSRLVLLAAAADDSEELAVVLRAAESLGATVDDLAPAEHARLVRLSDGALRFRHPLIRSAAYQSAPSAQRTSVHRALARAFAVAGQPDRQAWHMAAGATGPDEAVAAELERAAEHARVRGGYAAEAAAYERASLLSPDPELAGRRLALAAGAAVAAGELRSAGAMADRATRLVQDPAVLAGLADVRALVEFEAGSSRRAGWIHLDGAAAIAATAPEQAAKMLIGAVHSAVYSTDEELARLAAARLAVLDLPPDLAAFVPAMTGMANLLGDDLSAGTRELRDGLRAMAGLTVPSPELRRMAAVIAQFACDDALVHRLAAELAAECRAQGRIGLLPHALQLLAAVQQFRGHHAEARAHGLEALAIARDTGQHHRAGISRLALARIAAIEGDEQTCHTLLDEALTWDSASVVGSAGHIVSLLDLGYGRTAGLPARLSELASGPARHMFIVTMSLPDLVEAAVAEQQHEQALRALARFEQFASAAKQPWASAVALRCQALLGHDPEASFAAAVRLHADGSRPFDRARTELAYGRWLRRERRRTQARAQLESALAIFTRLGAQPWRIQAVAELRAAGVTAAGVTAAARTGGSDLVEQLTAQELQVVRRAADGLSNREIAAELFLSPRTVGYHLYNAYPKLQVTTRTQLARIELPSQ
jgi:DNA-binding NarL/FixJ family response regulator